MSVLTSLLNSSGALTTYDHVLEVTQNNVANASTPGYARQTQSLIAMPFDPVFGTLGGVRADAVQSSRDEYAEAAVRHQTVLLGEAEQNVGSLTALQTNFDISGDSGLPKALNSLFQAFSAWGQTPNDAIARQSVLNGAGSVAAAFRQTAAGVTRVTQDANLQIHQTVDHVNQLVGRLRQFNSRILAGDHHDAGMDAQIHDDLEQLSRYVPFTAAYQADGQMTVLMNGQNQLLIGDKQFPLQYSLQQPQEPPPTYPDGPPKAVIQASDHTDVTAQIQTGQLGALLHFRNEVLPSYTGDGSTPGDLNTMAKQFADRVNQLLSSGTLPDGTAGAPLFTYDPANDTNIAATIAVAPGFTPDALAAVAPGPPAQANGIPLALSKLSNPQDAADMLNGKSFTAFYGDMASRAGSALQDATDDQSVFQSSVAQAQNLRQQSSGVNLNEEAMRIVEFQRAYEANARFITVLNQLTEETIHILS